MWSYSFDNSFLPLVISCINFDVPSAYPDIANYIHVSCFGVLLISSFNSTCISSPCVQTAVYTFNKKTQIFLYLINTFVKINSIHKLKLTLCENFSVLVGITSNQLAGFHNPDCSLSHQYLIQIDSCRVSRTKTKWHSMSSSAGV